MDIKHRTPLHPSPQEPTKTSTLQYQKDPRAFQSVPTNTPQFHQTVLKVYSSLRAMYKGCKGLYDVERV